MYNKIKNILALIIFFIFTFLITKYYFSEKNIILTNKSRSSYATIIYDKYNNLPVLANDTSNIIFYINDLESFKKQRKKRFWEKLISNNND